MIDKWTDKKRAEFVRYREECQRRDRRKVKFMVLQRAAIFVALALGVALGMLLQW